MSMLASQRASACSSSSGVTGTVCVHQVRAGEGGARLVSVYFGAVQTRSRRALLVRAVYVNCLNV